mmetsp:Transcript_25351/g.30049  ORF Transcript_25351/g.30049 Transcript_25351/m.30049 type:complete len:346 (+) Transcript_25351:36-1073(+)
MFHRSLLRTSSFAIAGLGGYQVYKTNYVDCAPATTKDFTKLRTNDFNLSHHHHGKAKVRVLKVRHSSKGSNEKHSVSEYTVKTRLYSPEYEKVFTKDNNQGLVATDTQKNTIYVVAKRTEAETPEQFGIDIAEHFLSNYPILTAVQIELEETLWERSKIDGVEHNHAFTKVSPERNCAKIRLCRGDNTPEVTSSIQDMTILKTTQSGFEDYLLKDQDQYTLLNETEDRCLSTVLAAEWSYNARHVDYAKARSALRTELIRGLFGPADTGVFSVSLQATIYDAGCLALQKLPELEKINITTPNVHYLPTSKLLSDLKVVKAGEEVRDVFQPTCEPSGMIFCEVSRK